MIEYQSFIYLLFPITISYIFYTKWVGEYKLIPYAVVRMFIQLFLIGFLLVYIFKSQNYLLIVLVLTVMIVVASFISTRVVKKRSLKILFYAFLSIFLAWIVEISIISHLVLHIKPWYNPTYIIPLSGMILAVCMNAISLASERFEKEMAEGNYEVSRKDALKTALIPIINSLFAVGLVTLPGLMTGQILSGVDPIIAVKYQIAVMLMLFGGAGLSSVIYLRLLGRF